MSEKISRRDALTGIAALTLSSVAPTDALANFLKKEPELSEEIIALQRDLGEGGRYFRALHTSHIDEAIFDEMVPRLVRVMKEFRPLHLLPEAASNDERKFIASENMPGLITGHIETFETGMRPDGKRVPLNRFCNFFYMHSFDTDYLATAGHCVENTKAEKGFYKNYDHADFAIRRLGKGERTVDEGEYTGRALTIDLHTTNDRISGLLGTTIGTKKGLTDAFYGPLIKMTDSMFDFFAEDEVIPEPLQTHIRRGFWKIIPPEQGDIERIVAGNTILKASGRSGSLEVAYDPARKGRVIAGNFIAVKKFKSGPFKGQTIGFYSGPNEILQIVQEERGDIAKATPEKKPAKPKDTEWSRRLFDASNN